MRYVLASFLFFLASLPVVSQTTYPLIEGPPPAKLAEASAMVDAVKKSQSPVALSIGGYALIQIKVTTKLTPYIVPGSNDCLATESIPKGKVYRGWFVPLGGKEFVYATIAADPDFDRLLVTGTVKGTATILWLTVANGEAVVVAGYQFDVAGGKPKPKPDEPDVPPTPVDDPLVKAFRVAAQADAAAGKADKKWLDDLAGIYEGASKFIPESIRKDSAGNPLPMTVGDLNEVIANAVKAAGIPEVDVQFPNLRRAVQQEIFARLGINKDSGNTTLTVDARRMAQTTFGRISTALMEIAK